MYDLFDGCLIIGILNMWLDLMFCNGYLCELVEKVKVGIWEVGGFLVEVLVFFVSENIYCLIVMMYCNFVVMVVEEVMCG